MRMKKLELLFKKREGSEGNRTRQAVTTERLIDGRQVSKSLSAYILKPNNIHFEIQEKDERIMLLLRKHVITNLSWLLTAFLFSVLPLLLGYIPLFKILPLRFQIIFITMWYLFVVAYIFEKFLSWYYNVFIITDERIIDVDFTSLLYKEISQAKIDNIEDVTFNMGGLARAMFNFGTVYVQTAGEKPEFDFEDVPNPDAVTKILNELMIEEEQEKLEGRAT